MEEARFQSYMRQAETMKRVDGGDYFSGYTRGLRRHYHGEAFGTPGEHDRWMELVDDDLDAARVQRGQGYRDGFNGMRPNPDRWAYCTQNGGDCTACSLVNYGRDCRNNPV